MTRRDFIKAMAVASATGLVGCNKSSSLASQENIYEVPRFGNTRILHITDIHGQLNPIYFREPNVNLGLGKAFNKMPHLVGNELLNFFSYTQNSVNSYAHTYLNFEAMAQKYGKMGGFAYIKTVLDSLRASAGGKQNTLTVDGGDLWQGSGTALWTRGNDMVEASNLLDVDVMVGHWEFTYKEAEVLSNIGFFKGDFLGQNIRIMESSLLEDDYIKMTEKYDGRGLYNEDEAIPFKPYVIKDIAGKRIAVIGQAFPRTANANPQKYFFPDWSFGLREDEMKELVADIRTNDKPDAVILVSHNGMDVDIKMASQVSGIDAIFGGHTHDATPKPILVKNKGGQTLVTNAGCSGKFIGVMDFDIKGGRVVDYKYNMLPIIANMIKLNKEVQSYIDKLRQTKYDTNVVESRNPKMANSKARLGKTYETIYNEKLCKTAQTLYRRGNFIGTWDQVLVDSLRAEYNADFAMSAGVRWGTSVLKGDSITMEDLLAQTSMTYGETYVNELTGMQIKNILEGIAENLFQLDPYLQSGGDMVRMGGLDYTIDPSEKLGKRISNIKKDNGKPLQDNQTYSVAGWAQVNSIGQGRLMWDVAADYLRGQGELKLTKINNPTIKGVKNNFGIADYDGELL